ncbi:MAG: hypothetical protein KDC32_11830 [Saprospiraceae bacterium]|nr:hypothetical protein [Saprospiraceae bacterium]MCB0681587.1 hypothetical protein [Saprospiraceae bacterium]
MHKIEQIIPPALAQELENCGIQAWRTENSYRFVSQRQRFTPFTPCAELANWNSNRPFLVNGGFRAAFPDTSLRLSFTDGSILLVYDSGHIRYIGRESFDYFSLLTRGEVPSFTQGDLVVFDAREISPKLAGILEQRLPGDQGAWWCRASPLTPLVGQWIEETEIMLGGNPRHKAFGKLRYKVPVKRDCRTVYLEPLGEVVVEHFPTDRIHPLLRLEKDRGYLITKLPGFSDPAREMAEKNR